MYRVPVICTVGLLLFGCTTAGNESSSATDDSETGNTSSMETRSTGKSLGDCERETITVVRVACYTEVALSENDESICSEIEEPVTGMNNCYNELA